MSIDKVRATKITDIAADLALLTDNQFEWTKAVIEQFKNKPEIWVNSESDIVTACVSEAFADALQIHHCFSNEALSKDRFEYALERIMNRCDISASLAKKGNPGHDITINGTTYSLKTQANKGLRIHKLHISKFMELGKGAWIEEADLVGLRKRFFIHMDSYKRILQLRRLKNSDSIQQYELVEIPKSLLMKAEHAECKFVEKSRQNPKPGRCRVVEDDVLLFDLYFDGGTERKLQVQSLRKNLCIVHASWKIHRTSLTTPTLDEAR